MIEELELRGDEQILDIGCGDGRLTAQLAERVPGGSVLGIDASSAMIDGARKHERANLSFTVIDAAQLPFVEQFDLIFSNAALHWLDDHRSLLSLMERALKPGGKVRVSFGAEGNCVNLIGTLRLLLEEERFRTPFAGFKWPWYMPHVDEYRELVRQLPFSNARVWGENADRYFPDSSALFAWIDQPSIVPFVAYLDPATAETFRAAVHEQMLERTLQPDGTCFETFRRLNLLAVR